MAKYLTKQRKVLTEYLEKHTDKLLSAYDIADALCKDGISKSAVYRNISALEKEGKLRRASKNGERTVFYQYTGAKKCRESLHLSCSICGRAYHLNSRLADIITSSLTQTENFTLDISSTVFYGVCNTCQGERA